MHECSLIKHNISSPPFLSFLLLQFTLPAPLHFCLHSPLFVTFPIVPFNTFSNISPATFTLPLYLFTSSYFFLFLNLCTLPCVSPFFPPPASSVSSCFPPFTVLLFLPESLDFLPFYSPLMFLFRTSFSSSPLSFLY